MDRRDFLKGALGASGAVLLGSQGARAAGLRSGSRIGPFPPVRTAATSLPTNPSSTGIEHFVLVMMENRSFDHMLGWYPGADGIQDGLSYSDGAAMHNTFSLGGEFMGCNGVDPGHGFGSGRVQYNHHGMDGFLLPGSGNDDKLAIGYYSYDDLATARPFNRELALNYTVSDNYFCSVLTSTFPNRMFMHAAASDRYDNAVTESALPTIWERLDEAGLTGKFYFHDLPTIGLFGPDNIKRSAPAADFFVDARLGRLANLSVVDPRFEVETNPAHPPNDAGGGTSADDHPHADVRAGDAFLSSVVHAVMGGPQWGSTVIVICYDEWGGFFDHVEPQLVTRCTPAIPESDARYAQQTAEERADLSKQLLGFRTPVYIVSPWSKAPGRAGRVQRDIKPYDHASILKMIEWRWALDPISPTSRDAFDDVANLATALDFDPRNYDATVPNLPEPTPPVSVCLPGTPSTESSDWAALRASDLMKAWRL